MVRLYSRAYAVTRGISSRPTWRATKLYMAETTRQGTWAMLREQVAFAAIGHISADIDSIFPPWSRRFPAEESAELPPDSPLVESGRLPTARLGGIERDEGRRP